MNAGKWHRTPILLAAALGAAATAVTACGSSSRAPRWGRLPRRGTPRWSGPPR